MPAFELSVVELALLQEEVHDENTVYTINKDIVEPFPDSSFLLGDALKKTYEETEMPYSKWNDK